MHPLGPLLLIHVKIKARYYCPKSGTQQVLKLDYLCLRDLCERLADLSDTLIRDVQDSLILQPAYLDIATTKRKADEVRFK